jgi:hypothetical protein
LEGKVTLKTSTGAKIVVWRTGDLYCAKPANAAARPDECLAVDLFEVIADLAGLDLERSDQAAEAIELSEVAQRRLTMAAGSPPASGDGNRDLPDRSNGG